MKYLHPFCLRRKRTTHATSRLASATSRRQRVKPKGFTLVEILIVLAIVGILAAILFPVFGSVRANARATACSSNLKQIGLAMLLYAGDHNGYLPRASFPPGAQRPRCGWPDYFFRYARNAKIFQCPEDETERAYDPACTAAADAPLLLQAGSYSLVGSQLVLKRREPSTVAIALDGDGNVNGEDEDVSPESLQEHFGPPRHMGAYNIVFGDGHVKRLTPDKMLDPRMWGKR